MFDFGLYWIWFVLEYGEFLSPRLGVKLSPSRPSSAAAQRHKPRYHDMGDWAKWPFFPVKFIRSKDSCSSKPKSVIAKSRFQQVPGKKSFETVKKCFCSILKMKYWFSLCGVQIDRRETAQITHTDVVFGLNCHFTQNSTSFCTYLRKTFTTWTFEGMERLFFTSTVGLITLFLFKPTWDNSVVQMEHLLFQTTFKPQKLKTNLWP